MSKNPYSEALAKESKNPNREKVVLGLSSQAKLSALAAHFLKEAHEVICVHFRLGSLCLKVLGWEEMGADQEQSLKDWCVAQQLEWNLLDLQKESDSFLEAYLLQSLGMSWKSDFSAFFHSQFLLPRLGEWAQKKNINKIATGHRARVSHENDLGLSLWKSKDIECDQSHVLSQTHKSVLSRCVLPLGHLRDRDMEKLLKQLSILSEEDSEKQVFEEDLKKLSWPQLLPLINTKSLSRVKTKGYVLDEDQKVYGEHNGLLFSEIGARDGLGALPIPPTYCVLSMDLMKQWLVVGPSESLNKRACLVNNVHWMTEAPQLSLDTDMEIFVHSSKQRVLVRVKILLDSMLQLRLVDETLSFRPKAGDFISFYRSNHCVGSARIWDTFI